jgi:hypothetical protein
MCVIVSPDLPTREKWGPKTGCPFFTCSRGCGDEPQKEEELEMGSTQLRQTKRRIIWTFLFVLGFCCVFTGMALAQVDQGAINGVVKDSSGAVIPGALVTLTNTDMNFVLQGKTDARGEYTFSPIKIGHYTVSASAPKFETTTQENVTVNIQDRLNIPLTLKLGSVLETVTVTTAPPMLQSESASVGQVMDTDTINNTPLNGRNWVYIAQLTAGVVPGLSTANNNGTSIARGAGTGDFSANGQRTTQNNFILDGVDNNVNVDDEQNGASYNVKPPPDALAEFKIDTSDYSAEFGHSAGAVMNVSIKSGTNKIHGDLWEYIRNTRFDSADWDSAGGAVPNYHQNQFGATLGLPIWKNKIFYFGDAEENRIVLAPAGGIFNVPTASERNGDFSELFNTALTTSSAPVGLFAPNSLGCYPMTATVNPANGGAAAYANPGGASVTALSGPQSNPIYPSFTCPGGATTNLLNAGNPPLASGAGPGGPLVNGFASGSTDGELDTVAQAILNDYPLPNTNGATGAKADCSTPGSCPLYNNYSVNAPTTDDTFHWDQRLDWNVSAKDQAYARYSYTNQHKLYTPPLGPIINGGGFLQDGPVVNFGQNFMLSETHLFSPKLINEFRFGYNWGLFGAFQADANVPASVLVPGLGGVPFAGVPFANGGIPYMSFRNSNRISNAGANYDNPSVERQNVYQIQDNVTKVWRNHSFKLGVQFENIRTAFAQPSFGPRGFYRFRSTMSSSTIGNTGNAVASFLMDDMDQAEASNNPDTQYYRWYRAGYAQDDWKVNSKLTINLGVRYDFIEPETNNAGDVANFVTTSQGIDVNGNGFGTGTYQVSSSVQSQNIFPASYVASLGANHVNIGYLNSKSLMHPQKTNFAPRVGFAYQIDPKTVVRAGFGMFFGAIELPGGAELTVNFPWNYTANMYNAFDNGGNCYPSPYAGASNEASACPGNGAPDYIGNTNPAFPSTALPPTQALPFATSLEVGVGAYLSGGLLSSYAGTPQINRMDPQIKTPYTASYNLTVERQIGRNMIATVGYVGNFARHTWSNEPSYGHGLGLTNWQSSNNTNAFNLGFYASSWTGEQSYNALQTKLEQRLSNGLSFLATYTWSHAMDDGSNTGIGGGPGNFRNENLIPQKDEFTNAVFDVRQRVTVNGFYELPFGKGKKWAHEGGVLDYIVGGWQTSLTWVAQTGQPFTVSPSGNGFDAVQGGTVNAIRIGDPFKGGGTVPAGNLDITSCPTKVKTKANWFNPCAFTEPLSGVSTSQLAALGDTPTPQNGPGIPWTGAPGGQSQVITGVNAAISYLGGKQNQIYGPGYERVNMSLFKNFKTWRAQYFQFRADAFNLLNHPSWGSPSDTTLDSTAGKISTAASFQANTPDARFFQLAGKYVF